MYIRQFLNDKGKIQKLKKIIEIENGIKYAQMTTVKVVFKSSNTYQKYLARFLLSLWISI